MTKIVSIVMRLTGEFDQDFKKFYYIKTGTMTIIQQAIQQEIKKGYEFWSWKSLYVDYAWEILKQNGFENYRVRHLWDTNTVELTTYMTIHNSHKMSHKNKTILKRRVKRWKTADNVDSSRSYSL